MAKSREKIDFMLNELEFIHLSISLYLQALYDDNGSFVARVFIARSRLAERWRRIENTAASEHTNTISGRIRY